jgi:hypothetical protein
VAAARKKQRSATTRSKGSLLAQHGELMEALNAKPGNQTRKEVVRPGPRGQPYA